MDSDNFASASIVAAAASTNTLTLGIDETGLTEAYTISMSNMTNIDNLIVSGFSASVTLTDTVGLTSVTGSTYADTFDATGMAVEVTLAGGGGADVLTAGADRTTFIFNSLEDYDAATISATEGYNTISLNTGTMGVTLEDSSFAKLVDNGATIGTFQVTNSATQAFTFGTTAQEAGLDTFIVTGSTFGGTFTVEAGFVNALDITSGGMADIFTINSTGFHNFASGTGWDTFNFNVLPPRVMINGGNGTDTVSFAAVTDAVTLGASQFQYFSNVEILLGSTSAANAFTLGTNASAAGLSTIVGGNVDDSFTINVLTTKMIMNGGDGNDTFSFTNQANFTTAIGETLIKELRGGDGVDTLSFASATSAITMTDTHFASMESIESLVLGNGTNVVTLGANAHAAGIVSVIGGTAADTFNAASFNGTAITLQGWAGVSTSNTSNDSLTGGGARDLFVLGDATGNAYGVGTNAATITGFDFRNDKIQLWDKDGIGDVTFTDNGSGQITVAWGGSSEYNINYLGDRLGGSIVDIDSGNTIAVFTDRFLNLVEARNFTFL